MFRISFFTLIYKMVIW